MPLLFERGNQDQYHHDVFITSKKYFHLRVHSPRLFFFEEFRRLTWITSVRCRGRVQSAAAADVAPVGHGPEFPASDTDRAVPVARHGQRGDPERLPRQAGRPHPHHSTQHRQQLRNCAFHSSLCFQLSLPLYLHPSIYSSLFLTSQ